MSHYTLYQHLARIGHAASNPHRLRLLNLLAQGEKSVDRLAGQIGQSLAATSAHLKVLRAACLVEHRKDGRNVRYRLAGDDVSDLVLALRNVGEKRLPEVREVLRDYFSDPDSLVAMTPDELAREVRGGRVTLLDVRPEDEYAAGHLPGARSVPFERLEGECDALPRRKKVVAYCRGPYCVRAVEAVEWLRKAGFRAYRLPAGVTEWKRLGGRLEGAVGRPAALAVEG